MFVLSSASATVLVKMEVEQLTKAAGEIVQGVVEEVRCEKDPNNGRLYTYNTILVKQNIKGQAEERVVIRQLGGSYNGVEMWISGTPRFTVGEEVVVFLKKDKNVYFLRGMGQGAFSIKMVEGAKMAFQKTGNVALYNKDDKSGQSTVQKAEAKSYEFTRLLQDIQRYMSLQKAEK